MNKFIFTETKIKGLIVISPAVREDSRGYFFESYNKSEFVSAGITAEFVQDNESRSERGVLRGMHFQKKFPQAKLVRALRGEVYDVAVDMREGSGTYGMWEGIYLSGENKKMVFVPKGFAHGFLVVSNSAVFSYKCDDHYHPEDEGGFIYNDPGVGIIWPDLAGGYALSEKDSKLSRFD